MSGGKRWPTSTVGWAYFGVRSERKGLTASKVVGKQAFELPKGYVLGLAVTVAYQT